MFLPHGMPESACMLSATLLHRSLLALSASPPPPARQPPPLWPSASSPHPAWRPLCSRWRKASLAVNRFRDRGISGRPLSGDPHPGHRLVQWLRRDWQHTKERKMGVCHIWGDQRSWTLSGALSTPGCLLALLRELSHVVGSRVHTDVTETEYVPKNRTEQNRTDVLYKIKKRVRKSILTFRIKVIVDFVFEGFRTTLSKVKQHTLASHLVSGNRIGWMKQMVA